MTLDIESLLVEISDIHSEADIEQEVTDAVSKAISEAVEAAVPDEVSKDTAALQAQIDSYGNALKAIVDKLTAPGVVIADAVAGALTTAQNALPAAPAPAEPAAPAPAPEAPATDTAAS